MNERTWLLEPGWYRLDMRYDPDRRQEVADGTRYMPPRVVRDNDPKQCYYTVQPSALVVRCA